MLWFIPYMAEGLLLSPDNQATLVERLREGDEKAFSKLFDAYHLKMTRLAKAYVDEEELADEIVQETWMAVIEGLDSFRGDSSLKTWIFSILTNQAKKLANRESRSINWSSMFEERSMDEELSTESERFDSTGRWTKPPSPWHIDPEERMVKDKMMKIIRDELESLPANQRAVVTLRDIEGVGPEETCDILDISDNYHRVLLHRGRVQLRQAVTDYLSEDAG